MKMLVWGDTYSMAWRDGRLNSWHSTDYIDVFHIAEIQIDFLDTAFAACLLPVCW